MTTDIFSLTDLINYAPITGSYRMRVSITVNDSNLSSFPISIGNSSGSVSLDGNKITFSVNISNPSTFPGFFKPVNSSNVSIQQLRVNMNSCTLTTDAGGIISSRTDVSSDTLTITNCAVYGSFFISDNCGGIIGASQLNSNESVSISNCYSTGTVSGQNAGGLCGKFIGSGGHCTISKCYSTGNISGNYSGGIVGSHFVSNGTSPSSIIDCYTTGDIASTGSIYSSGIAGDLIGGNSGMNVPSITISLCYVSGNFSGFGAAFIVSQGACTLTLQNLFALNATTSSGYSNGGGTYAYVSYDTMLGYSSTTSNTGYGSPWNNTLVNLSLTDNATNWDTTTSPYRLKIFESSPWDPSSYSSESSATVFGDPYFIPYFGNKYEIKSICKIKLFDNNLNSNRFIIYGEINKMKNDYRSNNMNYLTDVYMVNNNKNIHINTGFRGKLASIIENNGFNFINTILPFESKIKRKCSISTCNYVVSDSLDHEHHNVDDHYIPNLVRNFIKIDIEIENDNGYIIEIMNVDNKNANPCCVNLGMIDTTKCINYSGALIKYDDKNYM